MTRAKKSFGQHFLRDRSVILAMLQAADVKPGDRVVEVGPGEGAITQALVDTGAVVTAIEADKDLIPPLQERFGDKVQVVFQDVLKVTKDALGIEPGYKVVANLPYNIGAAVVQKFLTLEPRPEVLVVMLQKEVVDRMLAKPGEMGVLSVVTQLYADCSRIQNVKPAAFSPKPRVDSAIVKLVPKKDVDRDQTEQIIQFVKAGFSARRKQLHKNFASAKVADSDQTKQVLLALDLPETARAQELSINQWGQLFEAIQNFKG